MVWYPNKDYRRAFKKGMKGWDVYALQVNLRADGYPNLAADGDFGPRTDSAVRDYQQKHNLTVDGIAGIVTQRSLIIRLSQSGSTQYALPQGLLKGLCENESGFAVAAYSEHPSDNGFDLGPYQNSITPANVGNQDLYTKSFDAKVMAQETSEKFRAQRDKFAKNGLTVQRSWELAALYHNWPFAATNLAETGHIYPSNPAKDDQEQQWIVEASAGRLRTARQWTDSYIQKVTIYCDWS